MLQQFAVAFAKRDVKLVLNSVTDTIRWNIVGGHVVEGRKNLAEYLKQLKSTPVVLLTIHHIASHGKAGAVDGTQKLKNGEMLAFCNVYEFGNTKGTLISEVTSYMIPIM